MSRLMRAAVLAYALAFVVLTLVARWTDAFEGSESRLDLWFWLGGVACAYCALAIAFLPLSHPSQRPWRPPLLVVGVCIISIPSVYFADGWPPAGDWLTLLVCYSVLLPYLALTAWILRIFATGSSPQKPRSPILLMAILAGGASVFSSLGLNLTSANPGWADVSQPGWQVLLGKASWITTLAHLAPNSYQGPQPDRFSAMYAWCGWAAYLLAIVATVLLLLRTTVVRGSIKSLSQAPCIPALGVAFNFVLTFIYTDIFWGWHFTLRYWAVPYAMVLWLAAPIAALIFVLPTLWRPADTSRLKFTLLLQTPIAAFNLIMFPHYLHSSRFGLDLNIIGLTFLMIGLQILSWAAFLLLDLRKTEATVPPSPGARVYAPAKEGVPAPEPIGVSDGSITSEQQPDPLEELIDF